MHERSILCMNAVAVPADTFASIDDEALFAPAMKGFFLIASAWKLDATQARALLGMPPERTFYAWKAGNVGRVSRDTLHRIGFVAGIWKALQVIYSDAQLADSWLSRPNADFAGQAPLARMCAGAVTDLAAVRSYLDAARAPW
jgi:uncharacterized protein (DUF2384 family)